MIEQEVREIRGSNVRAFQSRQWLHELTPGHRHRAPRTPPRARPSRSSHSRPSRSASAATSPSSAWCARCCSARCRTPSHEQLVQLWTDHRARNGRDQPEWLSPAAVPRLARRQHDVLRDDRLAGLGTEPHRERRPRGPERRRRSPGTTSRCSGCRWRAAATSRSPMTTPARQPVVILTDGLWRRRFGGDPEHHRPADPAERRAVDRGRRAARRSFARRSPGRSSGRCAAPRTAAAAAAASSCAVSAA